MSLAEYAVKNAIKLGATEAHAVFSEGEVLTVEVERDLISNISHGRSSSLGLATIIDRRIGFSSLKNPTEESVKLLAEKSYKLAKALTPNVYWRGLPDPKPYPQVEGLYDRRVSELTIEEAIELMKSALTTVKNVDRRVSVVSGTLSVAFGNTEVANSRGIYCSQESTIISCGLLTVAREGSEVGSLAYEEYSSRKMDINVEHLAFKAAEKALESLRPKTVKSFKGNVILAPDVSSMIFAALSQAYNGMYVWRRISPFWNKMNDEVAIDELTVIDDGVKPGGLASSIFDGEGSPRRTTVVIEKGVLRNFINNTFTARLLNMEETGNAAGLLDVAPSNTVVKPGDFEVEEMIAETKKGLYVGRFSGYVRFEDGLLSGAVKQAFLIENGERRYPVENCMISGDIYEVLRKPIGISRSLEVKGGYIVPTLMINDFTIVGEDNL